MLEECVSVLKIYLAVTLICVLFCNSMILFQENAYLGGRKKQPPKRNPESIFSSVILAKKFYKNNPRCVESPCQLCVALLVFTHSTICTLWAHGQILRGQLLYLQMLYPLVLQLTSPLNRLPTEWSEICNWAVLAQEKDGKYGCNQICTVLKCQDTFQSFNIQETLRRIIQESLGSGLQKR